MNESMYCSRKDIKRMWYLATNEKAQHLHSKVFLSTFAIWPNIIPKIKLLTIKRAPHPCRFKRLNLAQRAHIPKRFCCS